jgi:hypothetical protein
MANGPECCAVRLSASLAEVGGHASYTLTHFTERRPGKIGVVGRRVSRAVRRFGRQAAMPGTSASKSRPFLSLLRSFAATPASGFGAVRLSTSSAQRRDAAATMSKLSDVRTMT